MYVHRISSSWDVENRGLVVVFTKARGIHCKRLRISVVH